MDVSSSTYRSRVPRCPLKCSRQLECPWPSEPVSAASSDFYPMASQSSSSNSRTATISTGLSSGLHRLPQAVQRLRPASAAGTLPPEVLQRIVRPDGVIRPRVFRSPWKDQIGPSREFLRKEGSSIQRHAELRSCGIIDGDAGRNNKTAP